MPDTVGHRNAVVAAWDRFFFTPADPRPLGIVRIVVGLLLLWNMGTLGIDLRAMLGSEGWVDQAILAMVRDQSGRLEWSLWNLVSDGLLWPAWVVAMVVLTLFTAGFASRLTVPLAWAIAVSTTRRNPMILYGFDHVATLWAFYLAICGASGRAFSVDSLIAKRRGQIDFSAPSISANLGLRMIQVSLAIIYGFAGLAKVGGVSWSDGSAVMKTLGIAEFRPFDLTWVLKLPGGEMFLNLCTHLALWTELLYPFLIWKPAFRRPMIVAAIAMHAGIALTMGLVEFSLVMTAGNLAFLQWGNGRVALPTVESAEGAIAAHGPTGPASPPPSKRQRR